MNRKTTNINTATVAAGQPAWVKSQKATPASHPMIPACQGGTLYAGGAPTVNLPRNLVIAAVAAALFGALFLGFVLGAVGADNAPNKGGAAPVAYTAPTNPQDSQHGPVRAPNQAEANAYGMALETTYGTCSLEWHGDNGGWWGPVCEGPNTNKSK